ncbi:hypothetical protein HF086_015520 [Spodoptera exigua]|uniref:Secreted protein n=1 Tax=Spodoptera exigua TaxID=7107 RepID=A0A922SP93_SPOEX|nr:hypothetical protein HF086_015520 [Spodoptera exigua]
MMATWLLHAVAALLTVILLFLRQRCAVEAGASPEAVSTSTTHTLHTHITDRSPCVLQNKRRKDVAGACACSCSTRPLAALALFAENVVSARAVVRQTQPKYKRDPEITLDNESLGKHPREQND